MRVWLIVVLGVVLAMLAVSTGWKALYELTYALLAAIVLARIWLALSVRGLSFSRTTPIGRAQVGDRLEERLALENRSWFPKLWVQVSDDSTLPGHHAGYVSSLGSHKRITWRARTLCRQRGRYMLGPVSASTGDPLGLFRRTLPLAPGYPLLVLPNVVPLGSFAIHPGALPGRGRGSLRSLQHATNVVTVRPYVPGDPLTRIHWRSTARQGQYMVKEFDLDPTVDVNILLDLDGPIQAGQDAQSTEEYGVTIAASIATYLLRTQQVAVGVIVTGVLDGVLPLDRGERQLDRILELLAVVHPQADAPLDVALAEESVRLARSTVLVVITAATAPEWTDSVRHLVQQGVYPLVIALDASSFDADRPNNHAVLDALTAIAVPVIAVRLGDDLARVLQQGTSGPS
jgi:uncharacterized protein (DUF58 family)